ncbi:hydrolase/aminopeptidase [Flavobacterium caeni]|uniref:Aminopeptidase N n=1 Tax=Flavobacterium caeni TaxID=490189 RepID=A0A1G5K036_9FLAO|nr:hydrolase/aminopeptidase [Flavobacterium caeni]SCY93378.1 Aminopeptidase N [Flavobacterium caeni]
MKNWFVLALVVFVAACQKKETTIETVVKKSTSKDTHTFAQPDSAVVKHLDLDINVNFDTQKISGKASWTIDNKTKASRIIFDANTLAISKVTLGDDEKPTQFTLGPAVEFHGQPLRIDIEPTTTKVNIYYETSKEAVALQWLRPEQTADKKHPFLFSQGQSIWTRTWVPCQDSPAIRFTYDAKVTVPKALMAVMSAVNPEQKNDTGVYHFKQDKPIPSYLMALAVGDIAFQSIDARTGVYAEPSVLKKAAWEFGELENMVHAAEKLFGPYRWGRYDVLVLPPSFPYGGMENPNLTFLTPGVIAGDRSLTSLLAHELGHSWSGNLVTNASWNDIWLNEGFTTYVEHRIGEAIFGKKEADMQDVLSRKVLYDNLTDYGPNNPSTALKVNVDGQNADISLTDIPYEKGYAFLQAVEKAVGRTKFDAFITEYFNTYAFKSISTDEFLTYFNDKLIRGDKNLADQIKAEEWIYKPDVPSNITKPTSEDFDRIDAIQKSWRQTGTKGLSGKIKSTNEKQHFIDYLPEDLTTAEMAAIDSEFNFTQGGNFVIKRQWFVQAIKHQYKVAYPAIEQFMMATSRTGSLHTLYKEMVKTPEGKVWANQIFEKAKTGYHATTVQDLQATLR